ncbi:MAG TPA: cytochrome c biogenesis protein CcsA [Clostridia bacterium]|nr:cytochrome c biogenesis protein CcsA [Clostridia bacterium]
MKKWIPWLVLAVFVVEIVAILLPEREVGFHLQEFGRSPVLLNGRVQPFDTVGRNALLQIRGTASVPLEEKKSYEFWKHPKKLKATEWLLEVMLKPEIADQRPTFLIHHPDLLNEFDLRGKGQEKSGLFYFSYNELSNAVPAIEREGTQVNKIDPQARSAYQKQVAKLYNALTLYKRVKNSYQPEGTTDLAAELVDLKAASAPGLAAIKAREQKQDYDRKAFEKLLGMLSQYDFMMRFAYPLMVPPADPVNQPEAWQNMGQVLLNAGLHGGDPGQVVQWYANIGGAYRGGRPEAFNASLGEYRTWLESRVPKQVAKGRAEFFYNNLQAFLHAMIIYLVAFVLGCLSWFNWSDTLRRSAYYITVLAWIVHTGGLVFRMVLEGRPPVTNLYSSAIFIGWAAVLLGLILERIYRDGIGVVTASVIGAITLIIAHNLALGGDTMEMLRAVLDTNFWLATHVITITLGYASTFVAGLLGILFIVRGLFTTTLGRSTAQALSRMVYGIVCFATLFSFIGTVLGGIWADQSWGRFWGWDPKENGALIIVLWNGIILHARWGGLVRERGLMNLAIFGNIVTSFSWFGVNMLGVGLHSYGFMDAAFKWLSLFVGSQLILIGLGLIPLKYWRSFRKGDPVSKDSQSTPQAAAT